jgi:2-phosphosulfolactate phosphatase
MFDSGINAIAVAPNPEVARELRTDVLPHALLCGEVGGLPPEGFDYGNSPIEFACLPLSGREAILATSNGTRALHAVSAAPAVFVGCLRNRAAVAQAAFTAARLHAGGVLVLCAGNDYGATFSLDDAVTAGAIADAAQSLCMGSGEQPELTDAALAALRLFASYGQPESAFREGMHGRTLQRLGFEEDLRFCSLLDQSTMVPFLAQESGGLLMLRVGSG